MATVCIHGPLRKLAGAPEVTAGPGTVRAVLRFVEDQHPDLAGWVLDERGLIRRHIHVYLNGERVDEEAAVDGGDRLEVLPAISGG